MSTEHFELYKDEIKRGYKLCLIKILQYNFAYNASM